MHVGEAALDAVVIEAQALVVHAEQVERGGVEVVAVGGVFLGLGTELIRRAVSRAAPDAAAREPRGERAGVVVAALALRAGLATELGRADD